MSGSAESSGFSSINFWENLRVYAFVAILFIIIMIIIAVISCFKSRIQKFAKKMLK